MGRFETQDKDSTIWTQEGLPTHMFDGVNANPVYSLTPELTEQCRKG